jgi:hypothetical protein
LTSLKISFCGIAAAWEDGRSKQWQASFIFLGRPTNKNEQGEGLVAGRDPYCGIPADHRIIL